jgi:hypothetical protein
MFPVLLFGVAVVVLAVFAYFSYQQRQKRIAELIELSQRLGWQFDSSSDYSHDSRFSQFSVFCRGSSRYAYDTMEGRLRVGNEAWPARMGDFHYQTTSNNGKRTTTHHHHFSYLLVELPYVRLPDLRIRREGFFDKIATAFGFDDIDFESAEFSKRYHVKSSDKRFAYDVVHTGMMEFLLGEDSPTVEIERGWCCLTAGSTWSPAEFEQRVNWVGKFFEHWPTHLVADLKSR